jgi:transposase
MSRDRRMREGSSIAATKARAVSWPTPGIVISQRQGAEALAICLMSASIAVRSLIIARKKLVGQRVTLENQIRGLSVVFGIRLPRALTAAFIDQALKASGADDGGDRAAHGQRTRRPAQDPTRLAQRS